MDICLVGILMFSQKRTQVRAKKNYVLFVCDFGDVPEIFFGEHTKSHSTKITEENDVRTAVFGQWCATTSWRRVVLRGVVLC